MSFVFVLAPLLFATALVLKYGLGAGVLLDPLDTWLADPERLHWFNQVSPVVFLGSLALALTLNAYALLRFNFNRRETRS